PGTPRPRWWAPSWWSLPRCSPMASETLRAETGSHGRNEGPRRFAFALGTFHAATLVVVAVLFAYRTERLDGLQDLNTWLGLALFALLWAASVFGTDWALG